MAKKYSKVDLFKAVKELREEEQTPVFTETQVNVFNSEYVQGYDQAMAVLDEKAEVHKKGALNKSP